MWRTLTLFTIPFLACAILLYTRLAISIFEKYKNKDETLVTGCFLNMFRAILIVSSVAMFTLTYILQESTHNDALIFIGLQCPVLFFCWITALSASEAVYISNGNVSCISTKTNFKKSPMIGVGGNSIEVRVDSSNKNANCYFFAKNMHSIAFSWSLVLTLLEANGIILNVDTGTIPENRMRDNVINYTINSILR